MSSQLEGVYRVYVYEGGGEFGEQCRDLCESLGFGIVERPSQAMVAIAPLLTRKLSDEESGAPTLGTLIFHPSALPYRRGRDSIKWAIAAGERVSAATWFWADRGLDTGAVCEQRVVVLKPGERPREAYERRFMPAGLSALGAALRGIRAGVPRCVPQDEALASYDPPWPGKEAAAKVASLPVWFNGQHVGNASTVQTMGEPGGPVRAVRYEGTAAAPPDNKPILALNFHSPENVSIGELVKQYRGLHVQKIEVMPDPGVEELKTENDLLHDMVALLEAHKRDLSNAISEMTRELDELKQEKRQREARLSGLDGRPERKPDTSKPLTAAEVELLTGLFIAESVDDQQHVIRRRLGQQFEVLFDPWGRTKQWLTPITEKERGRYVSFVFQTEDMRPDSVALVAARAGEVNVQRANLGKSSQKQAA